MGIGGRQYNFFLWGRKNQNFVWGMSGDIPTHYFLQGATIRPYLAGVGQKYILHYSRSMVEFGGIGQRYIQHDPLCMVDFGGDQREIYLT